MAIALPPLISDTGLDAPLVPAARTPGDLAWALKTLAARQAAYTLASDYYNGQHRLAFATSKFRQAFGALFQELADNVCGIVVDAMADRLQIEGIESPQTEGDGAATEAWELWEAQRLPRLAGEVHQEALVCGDAYLIIWPAPDGSHPVFYPNRASAMTVAYDPDLPGRIVRAAKAWLLEDGRCRLTLYYPDRIEKFVTRNRTQGGLPSRPTGFVPFDVEGEAWPLPNPYGQVPVFHFGNNAPVGGFGRSELHNVIPLQDALNKAVADMLVAMEFQALPQRWATGLEVPLDPATGKPMADVFKTGPGQVWATAAADTKFGEFDAANLTQFLEVQEKFRVEIARISGTPLHHMFLTGGTLPSGEALKTAEERFVRKLLDRHIAFGDVWEEALRFALRIAQPMREVAPLRLAWLDPVPRGEKEHLETLEIKQRLQVPQRQIWREVPYSDEEIDKMQEEQATVGVLPLVDQ